MKTIFLIAGLSFYITLSIAQNVGIGTATPQAMLNIKGSADTSQLVIDANATQSNLRPLIRLRNAAGVDLMHIHSDDSTNIFIGKGAGRVNTPGFLALGRDNSFIGSGAGTANTTGHHNSALGYRALFSNTTGGFNSAIGGNALSNNTTGIHNTANGNEALLYNTTGNENTAMGSASLANNTTGSYNTANGQRALNLNTTGYNNTASGHLALYNNSTGYDNIAIGKEALYYNTTGYSNTAVGEEALYFNTIGNYNTASGYLALHNNTSGSNNSAAGHRALYANTIGNRNTAYGYLALDSNTTGNDNTYIGYQGGSSIKTGNGNTAIGNNALRGKEYGNNNTAIGIDATVFEWGNNSTAIGNGAIAFASNQIKFGNYYVTAITGQVAYSYPSDARFKYNIQSNVPGLDFIKKLTPVTYYFDVQKFSEYSKTGILNANIAKLPTDSDTAFYGIMKKLHTGFLAQDVEKITKEMGYEFDGVNAPANERDNYSIAYSQFIMPLVKSVQEQQQQIEDLKKENSVYKIELEGLKARLVGLEKLLNK